MPPTIRPTDDEARALARDLLATAQTAALGVLGECGAPYVSRIAFALASDGAPISLVSDLAAHTRALKADPRCSLLVGEATGRGDPLNLPRLTLLANARFIARDSDEHQDMAKQYLRSRPKAKLYIGFADFALLRFAVSRGHLNGGFGRAFVLNPADMGMPD